MSTVARLLTYDDLCRMPDDGQRYEIIGGQLIVSPSPVRAHQELLGDLYAVIRSHVRRHRLGMVYFAPVDVRLSPHDVVQLDLLFIREDRLDIYKARGDVKGPPDLVVEIISPSSEKTDPGRKFDLYAASGVPEYWLADPATHRFQLFVLHDGRYTETSPVAGRLHSTVIAGLVLDPSALFAGITEV
ncbi:MAG: Uma2 family endonuclease [Chloroflexia bacterium]|nr:Uma2 family endonuclease [Chloroflexia bacterium]